MKLLANGFCLKTSRNGGIRYSTICWWSKDLLGEEKKPGAASRSLMEHMDGKSIIFQLTGAKVSRMSQAYTVMETVRRAVECVARSCAIAQKWRIWTPIKRIFKITF